MADSPTATPVKHRRQRSEEAASEPESTLPELPRSIWNPFNSMFKYYSQQLKNDQIPNSSRLMLQQERVQNFLSIPYEIERFMIFGYLLCLDSFLAAFTIIPMRALNLIRIRKWSFIHRADLLRAILFLVSIYLLGVLDASRLYHSIRGQAVIKLYVIFNVLEIADRLCCSFGHDILESLFLRYTLPHQNETMNLSRHFVIATVYVVAHSLVLFYQVITLNVAINSHNNALLTLLVSNQFVEIKGSVFKKFEAENLFQLSCSDIVERFQLSMFLILITIRNLMELGAEWPMFWDFSEMFIGDWSFQDLFLSIPWLMLKFVTYHLPNFAYSVVIQPFSFSLDFGTYYSLFDALVFPVLVVIASEIIVDWLKHAFITKFNYIRPTVYGRYLLMLANDYRNEGSAEPVTKRIGFASIPLACVVARIVIQSALNISTCEDDGFCWAKLVLLSLIFWLLLLAGKWLTTILLDGLTQKLIIANKNVGAEEEITSPRPPKFPAHSVESFKYNSAPTSPAVTKMNVFVTQPSDTSLLSSEFPDIKDFKDVMINKEKVSLENIDRYTLFKSRIP